MELEHKHELDGRTKSRISTALIMFLVIAAFFPGLGARVHA